MALHLTGRYTGVNGPVNGPVKFTQSPAVAFRDEDILVQQTYTTTVVDGVLDVILPSADLTNPSGWTYKVEEQFSGGRTYNIAAPEGDYSLVQLAPVEAQEGVVNYVGPMVIPQDMRDDIAALADRVAASNDANLTSAMGKRFRREFTDASLADWTVSAGTNQSAVAGTGSLVMTAGTDLSQTITVTSKETFAVPTKVQAALLISSKIANVAWYVDLVADNSGGVNENVIASFRMNGDDSTTNTVARFEVNNSAPAKFTSANITTTAQTGATPVILGIQIRSDEVWFYSRAADSTAGWSNLSVKNTISPDPEAKYRIRFRGVTGAVAPASSTTMTVSSVSALDFTDVPVEFANVGTGVAATAAPVTVTNGFLANNGFLGASTSQTGTTATKFLSAATTNATSIKTSVARMYGYLFTNTGAATRYVKFFNKASAPTVGTDVPVFVVAIPPNGHAVMQNMIPVSFATGLAMCTTTGFADSDTGAVGAGEVVGSVFYV